MRSITIAATGALALACTSLGPARAQESASVFDAPQVFLRDIDTPRLDVLQGTAGQSGAGRTRLTFGPHPAAASGLSVFGQVFLLDPGAAWGLSATNGLELRIGQLP